MHTRCPVILLALMCFGSLLFAQDLIQGTMAQDIDSADYYELVAWCRRLGLDDTGGRSELQSRLYAHYEVLRPAAEDDPKEGTSAQTIIIHSARGSEYFTIEGAQEDYLVLQGDVSVEFQDAEKGVIHRVDAQSIVVNQTRRMLTASDSVRYELVREEGPAEVFRGESFSFDMESWNGLIFDGRGESEREITDGEPVSFVFAGKNIIRRDDETVILQEGMVTSSVAEDPYWQIRADRIWVLAPGEWATRKAVLYVGRVPLFYLPFFFKPGDKLVFHPAVGFRTREGYLIQTTTYVVGEQEPQPSTFSFLRLTDEKSERLETVREGLFLTRVESETVQEETDILKIMFDYYSLLGVFAGVVAEFDPVFDIAGGLALSRSIYQSAEGFYTAFASGTDRSDWNRTRIGDVIVPFRFGFEGETTFSGNVGRLSAGLEYFSDPFFPEDFYDRREKFSVTALVSGGVESVEDNQLPSGLDKTQRTSINWDLSATGSLDSEWDALKTAQLSKFDIALSWQKWTNQSETDLARPSREFFRPLKLVAPDMNLRFAGELLRWEAGLQAPPIGATPGQPRAPGPGGEIRTPGGGTPQTRSEGTAQDPILRLPEALPNLPALDLITEPASLVATYATQPRLILENYFNTAEMGSPDLVDFEYLYNFLKISGDHRITTTARAWDGRFQGDLAVVIDGLYQTRFNRNTGYSLTTWNTESLSDHKANRLDFQQTLDLTLFPLSDLRTLDDSKLFYSLDYDFFRYRFSHTDADSDPVYEGSTPRWDPSWISEHQVGEKLIYSPGQTPHFLEVTADLPPLDGNYHGEADFAIDVFHTNILGGYREVDGGWEYENLIITETVKPTKWVQIADKTTFDLNRSTMRESQATLDAFPLPSAAGGYIFEQRIHWESLWRRVSLVRSTLSGFGFTGYLQYERRQPESPGATAWIPSGEESLLPARLNFSYNSLPLSRNLWRKRLALEPSVVTNLDFDLIRYTQSRFDITLGFDFKVHRFLDLKLSTTSYNNNIYRYVPAWAEVDGGTWINPLQDLLQSYRFFQRSQEDRRASFFNLRSFSIQAVHDLGDWQLLVDYAGTQEFEAGSYVLTPTFSITVEWLPIPEIRRVVKDEGQGLQIRE